MNIIELKRKKEEIENENAILSESMKGDKDKIAKWRLNRDTLALIEDLINQTEKQVEKLKRDSNLGKRFQSRTFETWDKSRFPKAYELCFKYARNFERMNEYGRGIVLIGNAGTGKTHLASAIANSLMNELIPVKFGTFINLLDNLKKAFRTDKDVVASLTEIPVLIIDDLGKEKYTEWASQILFQVIDQRYNSELPTIITTNLSVEEMKERFGEPITSRLMEMCYGIVLNGENYRYEKIFHDIRKSGCESKTESD